MAYSSEQAFLSTGSSSSSAGSGSLSTNSLSSSMSPMATIKLGALFKPDPNEVKLYANSRERENFDTLADLYSIIKTTDALEKAFARDAVSDHDYRQTCSKLLSQFKTVKKMAGLTDVTEFMRDYRLQCPAGYHRLVEVGVLPPPSVPIVPNTSVNRTKIVAETVQHFITLMDLLKLEMKAVDDVQPAIAELMDGLNNPELPDFTSKQKVQQWLTTLNKMKATDELTADQIRQMLFDINEAYANFHKAL